MPLPTITAADAARNETLDRIFWALSDTTRRKVMDALEQGGASVTELAAPHGMSLPGFMKHLRVLEDAGLVTRSKEGRVVSCELAAQPMQEASMWLARYSKFWNHQLDALGRYLYHEEEVNPWSAAPSSRSRGSASAASTPPAPKKYGKPGPTRRR
ncbi:MAG: metalloregulator ArsR/SmtB family transcription factor [Ramlibacter sp.]